MLRFWLLLLAIASADGRDLAVGAARIDITPAQPLWLSGYAVRSKPSEGAVHRLWAKALAIENGRGKTLIVTTDLIGLPRAVSDMVAARVAKEYGIERAHLLLNSSHTHSGPVVRPNLMTMYTLTADQTAALDDYANNLIEKLVTVAGAALSDLAPAHLSIAHGSADFAVNRRVKGRNGYGFGVNRQGPKDHDVPVIAVHSPQGKLRAVLFAYACHNTTLPGEFYQVSGDYAGFAQLAVEAAQPGVTALFMILCGGDQNPEPRGKLEQAESHGAALGAVVNRILNSHMTPIKPGIKAAWQSTEITFAPHSRKQFEKEAQSGNRFESARAKAMLRAYDQGRPVRRSPYPVQAIRIGTAN
ncbi:MAG: neutral/alkaline non-lysosomal ceramidase N-terminal domain-containing protein, partial [Acidobacteria bacterium]|nr:neutral/alkaline non-lysosomal ceramidase N-terminal domain-containing protein [Acidobacteriota bacterium]